MPSPLSLPSVLSFAGNRGPAILFGGVLVGLAFPSLADAARPWMGVGVFLFTLGSLLKADKVSIAAEAKKGWIVLVLAWSTFGVPLVMLGFIRFAHPDPELAQGMLLCMLAPPVGGAAAIAAMLRLNAPLALLALVAATIMAPFYLPALSVWLTGYGLDIDPMGMTVRLVAIVGSAFAVAAWLRRHANSFVTNNPHAMTGIAVLGLILVAVGAMRGMQAAFLAEPGEVTIVLLAAFAVNICFQVLGTVLFLPAGGIYARTVGLLSGNRNVTLVMAAAGAGLAKHQHVELFLAMSMFPIFMLPTATKWLFDRPIVANRAPLDVTQIESAGGSHAEAV
jgi:predicted Na+-dependent transporter